MSEIIINKAPASYRRYLTIGDAKGNFNQTVDNEDEAQIAAEEQCKSDPEKCRDFLKFLEKSGFVISKLITELNSSLKKKITTYINDLKSDDWDRRNDATFGLQELAEMDISSLPIIVDAFEQKGIDWLQNDLVKILWGIARGSSLEPKIEALKILVKLPDKDCQIAPLLSEILVTEKDLPTELQDQMIIAFTKDIHCILFSLRLNGIYEEYNNIGAKIAILLKYISRSLMINVIASLLKDLEFSDSYKIMSMDEKELSSSSLAIPYDYEKLRALRYRTVQILGEFINSGVDPELKITMVDPLIGALKDDDVGVRERAAEILGFSSDFVYETSSTTQIGGDEGFPFHRDLDERINSDNYGIDFRSPKSSLERLNELLCTPNFYDIWLQKKGNAEIMQNAELKKLADETKKYRNKNYAELSFDEGENVKRLNRMLLELIYSIHCPKWEIKKSLVYRNDISAEVKSKIQKALREYERWKNYRISFPSRVQVRKTSFKGANPGSQKYIVNIQFPEIPENAKIGRIVLAGYLQGKGAIKNNKLTTWIYLDKGVEIQEGRINFYDKNGNFLGVIKGIKIKNPSYVEPREFE